MKLAHVTGTVTATAKDSGLVGFKLLITDLIDARGKIIEPAVVAVDTCGAGVGDQVLLTFGSAARLPGSATGTPVDASVVAVVDTISVQ